ncbi:MAG: hypothetical protein AAGA99_09630 [Actinomycetota bacterium]
MAERGSTRTASSAKRAAPKRTAPKRGASTKRRTSGASRPQRPGTPSALGSLTGGRRLSDPHDREGQVALRGIGWAALVALAVSIGPWPVAVVLGAVAGWAAWEIAEASAATGLPADRYLSASLAAALPLIAWFDTAAAGALLIVGTAGAVAVAWQLRPESTPLMAAAGAGVAPWFFVGLAAAGPMFTWRTELGAVVVLFAFVGIYDAGSHLVGVDAGSVWEGPVAGLVGVAVVAFAAAAIGIPPFDLGGVAWFAVVAAATLPLGPVLASLLVPDGTASAVLRRLDSLLVIGLVWPLLVGLYVQSL